MNHSKSIDLNELGQRNESDSVILNFLNILVKSGLQCKKFCQIGRLPKFFLPEEKRPVPNESLDMWPGYETCTKWYNDGIFLNVDTATKFINQRNILQDINDYLREGYKPKEIRPFYKPESEDDRRKVVITEHNSRQYQIDDITFDITPKNHSFTWKSPLGPVTGNLV